MCVFFELIFVGCGLLFIVCVLICTLPMHLLRIRGEKIVRQKKKKKKSFFFFAAFWSVCVSFVLWRQLGVSHFHRLLCNIILFRERRPPRILLPFLRVTAHTVDRVSLNSYHHLLGANYTSSRSRWYSVIGMFFSRRLPFIFYYFFFFQKIFYAGSPIFSVSFSVMMAESFCTFARTPFFK